MNQEQMKERCPDSTLIGRAVLNGYKIAFTIFSEKRKCGCADIVKSEGEGVWGLLYEISSNDLEKLDIAEGHPDHYKRLQVSVVDKQGIEHNAESYEVVSKQEEFQKPSKHYLGLMRDAAADFGFPQTYQSLLASIETTD